MSTTAESVKLTEQQIADITEIFTNYYTSESRSALNAFGNFYNQIAELDYKAWCAVQDKADFKIDEE
jgi:hypothetical protein